MLPTISIEEKEPVTGSPCFPNDELTPCLDVVSPDLLRGDDEFENSAPPRGDDDGEDPALSVLKTTTTTLKMSKDDGAALLSVQPFLLDQGLRLKLYRGGEYVPLDVDESRAAFDCEVKFNHFFKSLTTMVSRAAFNYVHAKPEEKLKLNRGITLRELYNNPGKNKKIKLGVGAIL